MQLKSMILKGSLMAALALGSAAASATTFSGTDVNLVGNASLVGGNLQLTPFDYYQGGAAWATQAWSTTQSFDTRFTFSLVGTAQQADGIAFVMQNNGTNAIGAVGGNIGVGGMNNSVAAGIQTWYNNRAGITLNGTPYSAKPAGYNLGAASDIEGTADVAYNATTHQLSFNATMQADGHPVTVSDAQNVNLQAMFGNSFYAGFTGATGGARATQTITSWQVSAVPEPSTYALMGLGLAALAIARRRKIG